MGYAAQHIGNDGAPQEEQKIQSIVKTMMEVYETEIEVNGGIDPGAGVDEETLAFLKEAAPFQEENTKSFMDFIFNSKN